MKDFSDFKCQWINKNDIWKQADAFRDKHWPENKLPVDIEYIIQRKLGLNIEFREGIFKAGLSNAWLTYDCSTIIIDNYAYSNDQLIGKINFDLAHEVGHFFLHKDEYAYLRTRITSIPDIFDFQETAPDQEYWNFEYQASEFGARLLIPLEDLVTEIGTHCNNIRQNNQLEKYRDDPEAFLYRISPDIADVFSVTPTNITERVKRENIWPPDCLK